MLIILYLEIWVPEELVLQFTNSMVIKLPVLCVQACIENTLVMFSLCTYGYIHNVSVCFWDIIQTLCIPVVTLQKHSFFGSSAEASFLNVWDHERVSSYTLSNLFYLF